MEITYRITVRIEAADSAQEAEDVYGEPLGPAAIAEREAVNFTVTHPNDADMTVETTVVSRHPETWEG
jgi:hypothetical protein